MTGEFSSTKEGRPNYEVDMDDLGMNEHRITYYLGGTMRLGERWRLRADYFGYHENSTKRTDFSFEFDDLIIPANARVDSNLDIDLYVVNLGYDIYKSNRSHLTIGLGTLVADLDLGVSGEIRSGDSVINLGSADEDLLAPLPNVYLGGAYALQENLIFYYGGGWMSLTYGDYDGALYFTRGTLEYWPFENLGFGAGYSYTKADIEYVTDNKKERYNLTMPGPMIYLAVGF